MQQGNLWRSQRPEAPNPALFLKALKSSRLCPEQALQQHWALDGSGRRLWIYTHANGVLAGSGQRSLHWHTGKLGKSVTPCLQDPAWQPQLRSPQTLQPLFSGVSPSAEQVWKILKSWKQPDLLEKCGLTVVAKSLSSPLHWAPRLVAAWCARLSSRTLGCGTSSQPSKLGQAWQDGREAASSLGLIPGFHHAHFQTSHVFAWLDHVFLASLS